MKCDFERVQSKPKWYREVGVTGHTDWGGQGIIGGRGEMVVKTEEVGI